MSTLNKARIVLCLLMFSCMMAFGQASKEDTPKLTRADVVETMSEMSYAVINGYSEKDESGSKMISALALGEIEKIYKNFYELQEIERITGYSREWYGKLLKIVQELEKTSTEASNAVGNSQQVDKLEQLKKNYKELQKIYKQTYEKPQKAK